MTEYSTIKPQPAWVDAGKGMSILLVILYHATVLMEETGQPVGILSNANAVLNELRMPGFFLPFGLFAAKWTRGTLQ